MPSFGQTVTVCYQAFNQSTKAGQTGDVANHTLRLVKDGVSAAPSNAPAEVDATNAPGVYSLVLTATESQHNVVILCGKSATANVTISPVTTTFEKLPTATPGQPGGLMQLGANTGNTTFTGASLSQPGIKVDGLWLINTNFGNPPLYLIDSYGMGGVGIDTSAGVNGPGISITSSGHAIQIVTAAGKDVYHCTIGTGGLMFNPAIIGVSLAPTQNFNNPGQTTPVIAYALPTAAGAAPASSAPAFQDAKIALTVDYPWSQPFAIQNFDATGWTEMAWIAKAKAADADSASILAIKLRNPTAGGDGLIYINGVAPTGGTSASDGSITNVSIATGANPSTSFVVNLTALGSAIPAGSYYWEAAFWISGVKSQFLGTGILKAAQSAIATSAPL